MIPSPIGVSVREMRWLDRLGTCRLLLMRLAVLLSTFAAVRPESSAKLTQQQQQQQQILQQQQQLLQQQQAFLLAAQAGGNFQHGGFAPQNVAFMAPAQYPFQLHQQQQTLGVQQSNKQAASSPNRPLVASIPGIGTQDASSGQEKPSSADASSSAAVVRNAKSDQSNPGQNGLNLQQSPLEQSYTSFRIVQQPGPQLNFIDPRQQNPNANPFFLPPQTVLPQGQHFVIRPDYSGQAPKPKPAVTAPPKADNSHSGGSTGSGGSKVVGATAGTKTALQVAHAIKPTIVRPVQGVNHQKTANTHQKSASSSSSSASGNAAAGQTNEQQQQQQQMPVATFQMPVPQPFPPRVQPHGSSSQDAATDLLSQFGGYPMFMFNGGQNPLMLANSQQQQAAQPQASSQQTSAAKESASEQQGESESGQSASSREQSSQSEPPPSAKKINNAPHPIQHANARGNGANNNQQSQIMDIAPFLPPGANFPQMTPIFPMQQGQQMQLQQQPPLTLPTSSLGTKHGRGQKNSLVLSSQPLQNQANQFLPPVDLQQHQQPSAPIRPTNINPKVIHSNTFIAPVPSEKDGNEIQMPSNMRPSYSWASGGSKKFLMEPHFENFCDFKQYPDDLLRAMSLQRVDYFIGNTTCSNIFYKCGEGLTFRMNCTGVGQVFDVATANCNYKQNVLTCPDYDHILHCSIREQCRPNQFACCAPPQQCIDFGKRCDGIADCSDGEDETNCQACESWEFPCFKSGKCIPYDKRCNGFDDCADGTVADEQSCGGCGPNRFFCSRSEGGPKDFCLELNVRCNGSKDCPNGEDELNCRTKGPKSLLCENQKSSVPKEQWCDGVEDCTDGSDEKYCFRK